MKTLISIFIVGISFLCYSQDPINKTNLVELDDVTIFTINANYLASVQDQYTPSEVALLQDKVAHYNISKSKEFDSNLKGETFEVIFKNSKGSINAFYNSSGKIGSAYERFNNIMLPRVVQKQLTEFNRDWSVVGNLYACRYDGEDLINRSYKILLEKGDDKKKIVIHVPN